MANNLSNNAFAFIHTFTAPHNPSVNLQKLQDSGITGINLALNYHGARDLTLGTTPALRYLEDGAHYYQPDLSMYPEGAITPINSDIYQNNLALEKIQKECAISDFDLNAWAVYFHNSAAGKQNPEAVQINGLGQRLLASLCPSNPSAQGYALGLTKDLLSRGIKSIAAESLHFHGLIHGEHHERYFIELSEISQYLLGFCLCVYCQSAATAHGADAKKITAKISTALSNVIRDGDPWLGRELSIEGLVEIFGEELQAWISSQSQTLIKLHTQLLQLTHIAGATLRWVDQSPLIGGLEQSWKMGINPAELGQVVDVVEPLLYHSSTEEINLLAQSYLSKFEVAKKITAILRPTFPDTASPAELASRVANLKAMGISNIDFYLFDVWRDRDLDAIKKALT